MLAVGFHVDLLRTGCQVGGEFMLRAVGDAEGFRAAMRRRENEADEADARDAAADEREVDAGFIPVRANHNSKIAGVSAPEPPTSTDPRRCS